MDSKYIIKHLAGTIVFFSLIFIGAGKIDFLPGIIYTLLGMVMGILNYTVFAVDKDLLDERSKPGLNAKSWDKKILLLSFLTTLTMFFVGGWDASRIQKITHFNNVYLIFGALLTATGQLIFMMAQKENKFFSSMVRIQADRGHQVCDTGLYSFVRHPAYFGQLIQTLGFPILFHSAWSLIPVYISILLILIRTHKEDTVLAEELQGYSDYSKKVKYRLFYFVY